MSRIKFNRFQTTTLSPWFSFSSFQQFNAFKTSSAQSVKIEQSNSNSCIYKGEDKTHLCNVTYNKAFTQLYLNVTKPISMIFL